MTRLLSTTACSRLSERLVLEAGGTLSHDEVIGRLEALDVDQARAAAGVGLAVVLGRLKATTDAEGTNVLMASMSPSQPPGGAAA